MLNQDFFKIFHLISDSSSTDVPEKVFLVEEELERLRRKLNGTFFIQGLIGPSHEIISYINKELENESSQEDSRHVPLQKNKINLEEKEIAAVFAFPLIKDNFLQVDEDKEVMSDDAKIAIEQSLKTVYLCFVTSDEFYYEKPIPEKSIRYLLIRFIGDLCSDIHILYDKTIEENLAASGCPYSSSKKRIATLKIVKRTEKDILTKPIACDFAKLYEFDPNYYCKLHLKSNVHCNNILHKSQNLNSDFRNEMLIKLQKDQVSLWKFIFEKEQVEANRILFYIQENETSESTNIIRNIIQIKKELKMKIVKFGEACLLECLKTLGKRKNVYFSEYFKENIYLEIIKSQIILLPETMKWKFKDDFYEIKKKVVQAFYEEQRFGSGLKETFFTYVQMLVPVIEEMFKKENVIEMISHYVGEFYRVSGELTKNKKPNKEEVLILSYFNIKVMEKEKIELEEKQQITIDNGELSKHLDYFSIDLIQEVQIYDLKNTQKSKLLCFRLERTKDQSYSLAFFSYSNNSLKKIGLFKPKGLLFNFHSEIQKLFIINPSERKMSSHKIDSLERLNGDMIKILPESVAMFEPIDFGVSIFPTETIFYIDKKMKALHSFNILTSEHFSYDRSNNGPQYLVEPGEDAYEYLRVFNETIYVALGNKKKIDIFHPKSNGKLDLKKHIKLDLTYLGAVILSKDLNQYLILVDSNKSNATAFFNMNCNTMLEKEENEKNQHFGNPILDVFYGAKDKFGEYKKYNSQSKRSEVKSLNLYHFTSSEVSNEKIKQYLEELRLEGHLHQYYKKNEKNTQFETMKIESTEFFNQIQTRIPIQLCTLENSNVIPLIKGKEENQEFFKKMTIADRCKIIEFGIVEDLMKSEPDKRVIVVSVMGAQSTGKSYLMNLLFGTRFTVSSSRTTIGIWLSILRTEKINYLLMDCEGLFSDEREEKEEEKLIRVLTSISDYTILNQNMSLNSRNLMQLMQKISDSIKCSTTKKNDKLYKGEMFIVVRDVKSSDSEGITKEFLTNFDSYRKKGLKYIEELFGGKINLFAIEHFEKKVEFYNDLKQIRSHIEEKGLERPFRSCQQVLDSLKVIINQITCDDSRNFEEEMQKFQIEKSKQAVLEVWKNGENENFTQTIRGIEFSFNQKSLEISEEEFCKESASALSFIESEFQEKVIHVERLKTTEYVKVYEEYNTFIKAFFQKRFESVEKKIAYELSNSLKDCDHSEKESELNSLKLSIDKHKRKFALCMEKCHVLECHLLCTNKFRHKFNIESEKETIRVQRDNLQKAVQAKKLNEEEKEQESKGLDLISKEHDEKLIEQRNIKELINESFEKNKYKLKLVSENSEKSDKIETETKQFQNNKMKSKELFDFISSISEINQTKLSKSCLVEETENKLKSILKDLETYILNGVVDSFVPETFSGEHKESLREILSIINEKNEENKKQIMKKEKDRNASEKRILELSKSNQNEINNSDNYGKEKQKLEKKILELKNKKEESIKQIEELNNSNEELSKNLEKNSISLVEFKNEKSVQKAKIDEIEKKRKDLNLLKDEIKSKVGSSLLSLNEQNNYLVQSIMSLNKKQELLNFSSATCTLEEIEMQVDELFKVMENDKTLSHRENKEKAIEEIKNKLTFLNFKISREKRDGEKSKLIAEAEKLQEYLNEWERLMEKKVFTNFQEDMLKFKNILKSHGVEQEWMLIEKLILLKIKLCEKKEDHKQKHLLLFESLEPLMKVNADQNEKELTEDEKNLILSQNIFVLTQKRKQSEEEREFLENEMEKGANFEENFAKLEKSYSLEARMEMLSEMSTKMQKYIFECFEKELKDWTDENVIETVFKEICEKNPNLKLTFSTEKRIKIEGEISMSFKDFIFEFFEAIKGLMNKNKLLEIKDQSFKSFEKKTISSETFNQVQNLICDFSQMFATNHELSDIKTRLSLSISEVFEREAKTESLNEAILKSLIEAVLEIELLPELRRKREKELENERTVSKEEEKVSKELETEQKQFNDILEKTKNMEKNIEKSNNILAESKLKIENIKKAYQTSNESYESKTKSLVQTMNDIKKNEELLSEIKDDEKRETESLKCIKNELEKLQPENNLYKQMNLEAYPSKLLECEKEFASNYQLSKLVISLNEEIEKRKALIETIDKELNAINLSTNGKTIDNINQEIETTQEQIEKIVALKIRVNYIKETKESINRLSKRLEDLENSSKSECKCLTNHECDEMCEGCKSEKCAQGAGHQGIHLCKSSDHKCMEKCSFHVNCSNQCNEIIEHSSEIPHLCGKSHKCENLCNFCEKKCSKDLFDNHEEHLCEKNDGCEKECLLCHEKCSSNDHCHDSEAETVEVEELNKETNEKSIVTRKLHLCSKEHECFGECNNNGICAYKYQNIQKKWIKNGLEREYTYTQQIEIKNKCSKKIPVGQIKHNQGECICRDTHTCHARCPDCGSLCQLEKDHKEKHKTEHRNQEELMYASESQEKEICVENIGESFVFSVGDVSLPTRCHGSCEAKGRGHYHLIECKGGSNCYEKKLGVGAKHSSKKYYPYPEKCYDMVLCKIYWELFNFEMPINKEEFEKCNFICPINHEREKKTYFCTQLAWHSFSNKYEDHNFECSDQHKVTSFNKMEICFLIDISGSMQKFIDESSKVIEEIIKKSSQSNVEIKFSFVGYRDHEMYKSKITMALKDLCIRKKPVIESLSSAVCNLEVSRFEYCIFLLEISKKYEINKGKENIRSFFSEVELLVLDHHYPFKLELESDELILSNKTRTEILTTVSTLNLGATIPNNKTKLKEFLKIENDQWIKEILQEEAIERALLPELNLLEVMEFSSSEKVLEKIKSIKALGGGDPPEAVLDGMDSVSNLNWSNDETTLRYVFHIFDAPPHGKQYNDELQDKFPDGCPCCKTHESIIEKLNKISNLNYIMYPLTPLVNKTLDLFEEAGLKFEKKVINKDAPQEFAVHATDYICKNLEQEQVMICKA